MSSQESVLDNLPKIEVRVYKRTPRWEDDGDVKSAPYQADIFVRATGFECHGVARTPALALCRAASYWEARFDAQKV